MPSYLVTGGSGQLGRCFQAVAKEFSHINLFFATRNEVDISRLETIANFYTKNPFDGIINCAAYTNVDKAEKEKESAKTKNNKTQLIAVMSTGTTVSSGGSLALSHLASSDGLEKNAL